MSQTLLLISDRQEDEIFARKASESAGLSCELVLDLYAAAAVVARKSPAVILADVGSPEKLAEIDSIFGGSLALEKKLENQIYFICSEKLEKSVYLLKSPLFGHFIHRNYGDPKEAGSYFGRVLRGSLSIPNSSLKELLKPGADVYVRHFDMTGQRPIAVNAVQADLLTAGFPDIMATIIATAADEMLLNAMYVAPSSVTGISEQLSTDRSASFGLEGRAMAELHIGFDGSHVAIRVIDHFGSLNKTNLLSQIARAFSLDEMKSEVTATAPGIGLSSIFKSGGSFMFICEPGRKTHITALFKKEQSFREFKTQFKFISTRYC